MEAADAVTNAEPEAPPAQGNGGGDGASNVWDFLKDSVRAILAVGALVYLTVFLVRHYSDVKDASAILGIVVPVLGAALGATIGYAGGHAAGSAGKDEAVKEGRRKLARQVREPLREARRTMHERISRPLKRGAVSPPGSELLMLTETPETPGGVPLETDALDTTERRLAQCDSILDAVAGE